MVYGTTAAYAPHLREEDNQRAELREIALLGAYSITAFGSASPAALAALMHFARPIDLIGTLLSLRRRLTRGQRPQRGAQPVTPLASSALPAPPRDDASDPTMLGEMVREIQRFKWLEAERRGRDIWRELDPADPERPAAEEWLRRHYRGWLSARRPMTHSG